jgi:hypothetical protein
MNNKEFDDWIEKHNINQIFVRNKNLTIPKELLALLRIVIETAYDDGYKEGFSDGKYGS